VVTDLILVASGVSPSLVEAVVPPACRTSPDGTSPVVRDGDSIVLDLGPWRPRCPARHLLPSFSALTPRLPSFRFELAARAGGDWSPWVATTTIGDGVFPPLPTAAPPLDVDVDVCTASTAIEAVRMRVRLGGPGAEDALAGPWLVTLSACDMTPSASGGHAGARSRASGAAPVRIAVPAHTQMTEDPAIARRICSPASVAMVLAHLDAADTVARVAADAFHPATDRYGVWPAAIAAAARRGVLGYLLRFPDWSSAAWCLDHGLPVIASVRFAAGELTGAPLDETTGHLLVVTGHAGDAVLVNDPAAPGADTVARQYALDEFTRAWLDGAGVGYVLFRPPA